MGTIRDLFTKPVLIFGCGNTLLGDDGFGPAVADRLLSSCRLPDHAAAFDAGTGVREILFDLLLLPQKPKAVFIVDAVYEPGGAPGEILEIDVGGIGEKKVNDFSLHLFPSVNLLSELQSGAGVEVRVLAVQAETMPEEVRPGLSEAVASAVPKACDWLLREIEDLR